MESVPPAPKVAPMTAAIHDPKWLGGSASCMAVALTHPLDLIKVRMQTAPPLLKKGTFGTILDIATKEGPRGFYSGLSAGMLRQLTYGSTRFAIYDTAKERASANNKTPSPLALLGMAAFSGFCGGIVGNPADICNVKMQNERSLPPEARQNYRHAFDVLRRIGQEQGPRGYFRGVWPNCLRAAGMTGFQLGSYDSCKRFLVEKLNMQDGLATQFTSSIFASLVATTICNPIDVIKTQTMSSSKEASSMLTTVKLLTKTEGVSWMWRGWLPSFARLGPHTVATLVILEQHRLAYRRYREWKQETAV